MHFSDVDRGDSRKLIEYLDTATRHSLERKRATYAAQGLAGGMHVLDLGCGTGDDARAIAALVGERGRVAGVDASTAMIDEARARGAPPNVAFAVADATHLPFDDERFDAARAERVFQHLGDGAAAARELHRVVKPGGSALLLDQDWESLVVAGAQRDATRSIVRAFVDHLANGWAGREARGLLTKAGFTGVACAPFLSTPSLPVAFETVLQPAMHAAIDGGIVDSATARTWLASLLEADLAGSYFCSVTVCVTVGRRSA